MNKTGAVIEKMIEFYHGNVSDINHFLKVYAYAKTIGELENLSNAEQESTEIAAVVHDIACPLCREKYGNTAGGNQEAESAALVRPFLAEFGYEEDFVDRICYIVSHHHTYVNVDKKDYQILLEADFLVNADEGQMSAESIKSMLMKVYKTESGKRLLKSVYRKVTEVKK